jgi:hypothetical protein
MNALQTLLAKGQSYNVLKALEPILQGTEEARTLILLMARWNGNENDYNKGVLSMDYYKMEVARINKSILSLMEQLEHVSPTDRQFAVAQQAQQIIQQIHHTYHNSVVQHHTGKGDNVAGNKVIGNDNIVISGVTGSEISIGRTDLDRKPKQPEVLKRILFLAAEPENKITFNAGNEFKIIQDALNKSSNRSKYELIPIFQTNLDDLTTFLRRHQPEIVHFSMHGSKKGVYFEEADGTAQVVEPDLLGDHFELVNAEQRIINLVLMSACHSAQHAEYLAKYVGTAIGMNGMIENEAAFAYTKGFYSAFFEGDTYKTAHLLGCLTVKQNMRRIPMLANKKLEEMPKIYS